MPQLFPMNWLFLSFILFLMFSLLIINLFFLKNYKISMKSNFFNLKLNEFKW
uniref:ATP synthase F0 subunit 8 n=1 Tax=Amblyomma triste TaxID=251400 RepID=UPI00315DF4BB